MDIGLLVKAAVMGLVEGFTEFLPVSSTGHLILAGSLLDFTDAKAKVFDIAIQSGAIVAVILVYWHRLRDALGAIRFSPDARRFVLNIGIAFLPAVVLGLLFGKAIKAHLFNAPVVATTFILGGLVILWAERRPAAATRITIVDAMTPLDALKVGLVQCLAMIPGTSRSGPTLTGAGVYSLYKERALLSMADLPLFGVGFVVSFLSAWLCVRWLLRYIATHTFVPFAWYRIAFGVVVLATAWSGVVHWAE